MQEILKHLEAVKAEYDAGGAPLAAVKRLAVACDEKLRETDEEIDYGFVGDVHYVCLRKGHNISRPLVPEMLVRDPAEFEELWTRVTNALPEPASRKALAATDVDALIYTTIMGFAAVIDLWKPGSRKTPGTYFEVVLGTLLSLILPDFVRSKFVTLPDQDENVSTDIVFKKDGIGLVIPAKITTRERIVQPFAHQRILDSVFGEGHYKSVLLCISETQRDNKTGTVKNICVPGTIKLFQSHLAKLSGIYYVDPPRRYLAADLTRVVPIATIGKFLTRDLDAITTFAPPTKATQPA